MMRAPWLLIPTIFLLVPALLRAEDTFTIKLKPGGKGDKGTIIKDETKENHTVVMKDGKVLQKQDEVKKESAKYTEEILEKEADKAPTKVRRTYEKATLAVGDGKATDQPYSGKTLLIEKKEGKYTFRIDKGDELDAKNVPSLAEEFSANKEDDEAKMLAMLVPKKPVAVGDSWTVDKDALKSAFSKDQFKVDVDKSKATGKLLKAYKKDGKQYGQIQYDMELPVESMKGFASVNGMKIGLSMTMDVCIDGSAEAGLMKSKFTLKGQASAPGGIDIQFDITGDSVQTREEASK